ncbi:methylamine utilization protein MauG [Primorskyibacter aestuariivivens]|uniref:cytochrome-c peroxidase n=1 Tax=Primorskyibacter aestuariivivens TaxID=1888912 RepID=UPI00230098EB|nr:cytochrome c peroxidase [Primorskyibacter aestuariivivens]MDA7427958.1 methylamine utilization protein MauG [Primorskyibacter aestuariivivens]
MMIRTLFTNLVTALSLLSGGPLMAGERPLPTPITADDFRPFDTRRAALGQLLFYDKLLSGNRNISCATCHHPEFGTSDGLSLGVGEGGVGIGPTRRIRQDANRPLKRVPRNAPALFNLGHKSVSVMFHDGRVTDADSYGVGFNTPVEEWLPPGLQSVLAAQSLIPLTSKVEMAGSPDENDLAAAANRRIDQVWPVVVTRLQANPDYVALFKAAFDDIDSAADITAAHLGNALDDFQNSEWQSYASPFDDYLNGDATALNPSQTRGLQLFYGKANCASCHSGPLLTDQGFHALALPPFGPGRVRLFDLMARDVGRMSETDLLEDAYRFRTPSLRNVALTAPYGHNGAFATLEGMVRHHLDPSGSLETWDRGQLVLADDPGFAASDFNIWQDSREMARLMARVDIEPVGLSVSEVADLVAFLHALTDPNARKGRLGSPETVPSGLPVDQQDS